MKVKGRNILNDAGEVIGSIVGSRSAQYDDAGYSFVMVGGARFGEKIHPRLGYAVGRFAYFQDAARYVRDGGLEREINEAA